MAESRVSSPLRQSLRTVTLAWGFGALGLLHGLLMGFGRMTQGSHWPSDVLWSAGFVYLIAWGLNWILVRKTVLRPVQTSFTPAPVVDTV